MVAVYIVCNKYGLYVDAVVMSARYVLSLTQYRLHLTYLYNLAGTDYELPQDDTIVSKHVGAI